MYRMSYLIIQAPCSYFSACREVLEGTKTIPANLYYQFNGAISPTYTSGTDTNGNTTHTIDFTDSGTYLLSGIMLAVCVNFT